MDAQVLYQRVKLEIDWYYDASKVTNDLIEDVRQTTMKRITDDINNGKSTIDFNYLKNTIFIQCVFPYMFDDERSYFLARCAFVSFLNAARDHDGYSAKFTSTNYMTSLNNLTNYVLDKLRNSQFDDKVNFVAYTIFSCSLMFDIDIHGLVLVLNYVTNDEAQRSSSLESYYGSNPSPNVVISKEMVTHPTPVVPTPAPNRTLLESIQRGSPLRKLDQPKQSKQPLIPPEVKALQDRRADLRADETDDDDNSDDDEFEQSQSPQSPPPPPERRFGKSPTPSPFSSAVAKDPVLQRKPVIQENLPPRIGVLSPQLIQMFMDSPKPTGKKVVENDPDAWDE